MPATKAGNLESFLMMEDVYASAAAARNNNSVSRGRRRRLARFNDAGGHSAVAEHIDRALACMEAWGLLSGRSQ